jgi:hypothetical protein
MTKRIIRDCVKCQKMYKKPCEQLMAELPLERITTHQPAFSSVGIDVFGPFYVKVMGVCSLACQLGQFTWRK